MEGTDEPDPAPATFHFRWGQFHLRGAKLRPDLKGIAPATLRTSLPNEKEHGFHEGAPIRKRNGIYSLVYTDIGGGKATRLSYATSRSPLGPFTKGGVIVDNDGCDRESWNNHGSIAEFGGQWYVFHHRSSQASRAHRRVCVEPIRFDAEGTASAYSQPQAPACGPATRHTLRHIPLDGRPD